MRHTRSLLSLSGAGTSSRLPQSRLHTSLSSKCCYTTEATKIKDAFDAPYTPNAIGTGIRVGRFKYKSLQNPEDLKVLSEKTVLRANAIVSRILAYSPSVDQSSQANLEHDLLVQVKQIDRLSDLLCSLIDLTELVRNIDDDSEWRNAADRVYQGLCFYMNELNTHVGLYRALKTVYTPLASGLDNASLAAATSARAHLRPALTVASQFLLDFEKSGIHLPQKQRAEFVALSDEILSLGRKFTSPSEGETDVEEEGTMVPITESELKEVDLTSPYRLGGTAYLHIDSPQAQAIRRQHPSENVRRRFYEATYTPSSSKTLYLEELLKKRYALARLVGKESWSQVALTDKMAKSPENVLSFLTSLAERNRPSALHDLSYLQLAKREHLSMPASVSPSIHAWDWDYYYSHGSMLRAKGSLSHENVYQYFSIGTCIAGLSDLFSKLYGIRFEVEEMGSGESWNDNDVRKLSVIDAVEGKIGEIYCDLFARGNKPQGAAHFTVRCSRRLDDDHPEIDLNYMPTQSRDTADFPLHAPEGLKYSNGQVHQLPIVVLTCNFSRPSHREGAGLLSWQEVETLFHEMGHAMHSMIGRTDYHNVAGTRCATDLVELPSILMEHFLSSPTVLKSFAKHYRTGKDMSDDTIKHLQRDIKVFSALQSNAQIVMAILDQRYHANIGASITATGEFDSTAIYQDVAERFAVVRPAPRTAWQSHFTHLFGYGATYYSYLFDRAIAYKVYQKLFSADPFSRDAGETYKSQLLRFGGGKDPWLCVANTLGGDEKVILEKGDSKSMDLVGSWNVE